MRPEKCQKSSKIHMFMCGMALLHDECVTAIIVWRCEAKWTVDCQIKHIKLTTDTPKCFSEIKKRQKRNRNAKKNRQKRSNKMTIS